MSCGALTGFEAAVVMGLAVLIGLLIPIRPPAPYRGD